MGISAGLFHSGNDSERQTLHRRISPSEEQFNAQEERWNTLAEYLLDDLKTRSGCTTASWLQGSYKFGTQIRPSKKGDEFDIDLGVYFEWPEEPAKGPHPPNSLRKMVQDSLLSYSQSTTGVKKVLEPPKSRCARIHYTGDFHIDVPSYHQNPATDIRTLAVENRWEVSDPRALYKWWKLTIDETKRPKARRHVRYLKCWAALKYEEGTRPSSVLLTVLVAEAFSKLSDDQLASDDDALRHILREIANRLAINQRVENPANRSEDLNRLEGKERQAFADGIAYFYDLAVRACDADTEFASALEWSGAFKQFFPMPAPEEVIKNVNEALAKSLVPVSIPDVRVTATSPKNSSVRIQSMNRIGPIPIGLDLEFEVVNAGLLPGGTTIEWMIRNEGRDAEEVNDLGHVGGTGVKKWETSAYRGTHFMDCILKRNGSVVGARRIPVVITGTPIPQRNPVKRPDYVKFRGKK